MGLKIKDGDVFVFQGDSITDCGRRGADAPFGNGYAKMVVDKVIANHPALKVKFVNTGISGNIVQNLAQRWEDDTIRFQPNWLSILIGINDIHHCIRPESEPVPVELYRETYDNILSRVVTACNPNIMLLEPFYISTERSESSNQSKVLAMIPDYIEVVHDMSKKYGTALVKTHEIFQEQIKHRTPDHFCAEPVHPNPAGHAVIAEALYSKLCE